MASSGGTKRRRHDDNAAHAASDDRSARSNPNNSSTPSFHSSFSSETDQAITVRSSRAGLGSQSRAPSASFNKHRDNLSLHGHVPKFLQAVIQSNPSVVRQLPPSMVQSVRRGGGEEDEDEEEQATRMAREKAERQAREAEEGQDKPVRDDELPVITNLEQFEGQEAAVAALLGRPEASKGDKGGPEVEGKDDMEKGTKHVFKSKKGKETNAGDESSGKKAKTSDAGVKKAGVALSFDEDAW